MNESLRLVPVEAVLKLKWLQEELLQLVIL